MKYRSTRSVVLRKIRPTGIGRGSLNDLDEVDDDDSEGFSDYDPGIVNILLLEVEPASTQSFARYQRKSPSAVARGYR
jgi:hypothetical protein